MSPRMTVHPSEKVLAVAAIYRSLVEELGVPELGTPPEVVAALIDASVFIAMGTDTQDLGIMVKPPREDAHH